MPISSELSTGIGVGGDTLDASGDRTPGGLRTLLTAAGAVALMALPVVTGACENGAPPGPGMNTTTQEQPQPQPPATQPPGTQPAQGSGI